ncbi:MAG: serine/threonine-protein kinase, partial [Bacteroidales bacterium]|nr:serine/threonine-protein kinase [Bacteroidales bacterium]
MDKYHFTDHQLLGQGGFSDVYHAINQNDGQRYAIKTFRLPSKDEDRQRVLRYYKHEAKALTCLDHPNIVRCIDHYVQANDTPIIIMPQIEGNNLRAYIETQGILPTPIATQIAQQVAHALEACHHPSQAAKAKGLRPLVHNDLHPRNIICTPATTSHTAPHCTLIDFGLSFPIDTPLTLWEKDQGVKEYKAPEKWTHDTLTPATDIYSFGVLLFVLFTGRTPFVCHDYNDTTAEEQLRQQCLTAPTPSLWALRAARYEATYCYAPTTPDLPYWWQSIAQRCLNKDPSQRYTTATELLADITQGMAGLCPDLWPEEKAQTELSLTETH